MKYLLLYCRQHHFSLFDTVMFCDKRKFTRKTLLGGDLCRGCYSVVLFCFPACYNSNLLVQWFHHSWVQTKIMRATEVVIENKTAVYLFGLSSGTWWVLILLGVPTEVSYCSWPVPVNSYQMGLHISDRTLNYIGSTLLTNLQRKPQE